MVRRTGIVIAFLLPVLADAQWTAGPTAPPVIADPSNMTALYESLMGHWFAAISPFAYDLFGSLALLNIAVFGWKLWRSYHGDIRTAMLETANKLLVIGFFLALLMNAGEWMADVIDMFVSVGKSASGMPGLGPSMILQQGFKIFGSLMFQALKSGLMTDIPTAGALILAAFVICGGLFSYKKATQGLARAGNQIDGLMTGA